MRKANKTYQLFIKVVLPIIAFVFISFFAAKTILQTVDAKGGSGPGSALDPQNPSGPITCTTGDGHGNPSEWDAVTPAWRPRLKEVIQKCRNSDGYYNYDQQWLFVRNAIVYPYSEYKSTSYWDVIPDKIAPSASVYGKETGYRMHWFYTTNNSGSCSDHKYWNLWIRDFDCDGVTHQCSELNNGKNVFKSGPDIFNEVCERACNYYEQLTNMACKNVVSQNWSPMGTLPEDLAKSALTFDTTNLEGIMDDAASYATLINKELSAYTEYIMNYLTPDSKFMVIPDSANSLETARSQLANLDAVINTIRNTHTNYSTQAQQKINSANSVISSLTSQLSSVDYNVNTQCGFYASNRCYTSGNLDSSCSDARTYRSQLANRRSQYYSLLDSLSTSTSTIEYYESEVKKLQSYLNTSMQNCASKTKSGYGCDYATACHQYISIEQTIDGAKDSLQEAKEQLWAVKTDKVDFDDNTEAKLREYAKQFTRAYNSYKVAAGNTKIDWTFGYCSADGSGDSPMCNNIKIMQGCLEFVGKAEAQLASEGKVNAVTKGSLSVHIESHSCDTRSDFIDVNCSIKGCYQTREWCRNINQFYVEPDEKCPLGGNGRIAYVNSIQNPGSTLRCRKCNTSFTTCEEAAKYAWLYDSSEPKGSGKNNEVKNWVEGYYDSSFDAKRYWAIRTNCEADEDHQIKKWIQDEDGHAPIQCTVACVQNCDEIRDPDTQQYMEEPDREPFVNSSSKYYHTSSCYRKGWNPVIKVVEDIHGIQTTCIGGCLEPCGDVRQLQWGAVRNYTVNGYTYKDYAQSTRDKYFLPEDTNCTAAQLATKTSVSIRDHYNRSYSKKCYSDKCRKDCKSICEARGWKTSDYDCGSGIPNYASVDGCTCVANCSGDACRNQGYWPASHVCAPNEESLGTETIIDKNGHSIVCHKGCKAKTPGDELKCAPGVPVYNGSSVTVNGVTQTDFVGDVYINSDETFYNERNAWLITRDQRRYPAYTLSGESRVRNVIISPLGYEKKERTSPYQICRWGECLVNDAAERADELNARNQCDKKYKYYSAIDDGCRRHYQYISYCFDDPPPNNCHSTSCGQQCRCGRQYYSGSDDDSCHYAGCVTCVPTCYTESDLGFGIREVPCVGPGGERTHSDFCSTNKYTSYEACKVPTCNNVDDVLDVMDRTNFKKCGVENPKDRITQLDQAHEYLGEQAYGVGGIYQCTDRIPNAPDAIAYPDECTGLENHCFHVLPCGEVQVAESKGQIGSKVSATHKDEFGQVTGTGGLLCGGGACKESDHYIFIPGTESTNYQVGVAGQRCGRYWEVSEPQWSMAGGTSNIYTAEGSSKRSKEKGVTTDRCGNANGVELTRGSFKLEDSVPLTYEFFEQAMDISKLPRCSDVTIDTDEFYICKENGDFSTSDLNPDLLRADRNLVVFMDSESGTFTIDTQIETARDYFKAFISRGKMVIDWGVGTWPEAAYERNLGCADTDTADLQGFFAADEITFPSKLVADSQANAFNENLRCDRQLVIAGNLIQWGDKALNLTRTFRGCVGGNEDLAAWKAAEQNPAVYRDFNKIMSPYVFYQRPDFQNSAPEWMKTSNTERIEVN